MFETDRLPDGWAKKLNRMDEIWVPTEFHYDIFEKYGVKKKKLRIIPEGIDTDLFDPNKIKKIYLNNNEYNLCYIYIYSYKFFSVFKWEKRKGWDVLLKAYFNTFNKNDKISYFDIYID